MYWLKNTISKWGRWSIVDDWLRALRRQARRAQRAQRAQPGGKDSHIELLRIIPQSRGHSPASAFPAADSTETVASAATAALSSSSQAPEDPPTEPTTTGTEPISRRTRSWKNTGEIV